MTRTTNYMCFNTQIKTDRTKAESLTWVADTQLHCEPRKI